MIDLDISSLMLYFGDDFVINEHIKIHQPTIKWSNSTSLLSPL